MSADEQVTESVDHNYNELGQYMYEFIKKVCVEVGPGAPATPQEKARGEIVKNEMKTFCDKVEEEEFILAPDAFLGWFKLGCSLICVGYVLFHLSLFPIAPVWFAFGSMVIAFWLLLMLVFEFILYSEFIDFLYPRKKSSNIVGSIYSDTLKKGSNVEEPKKIIIFSGHHDSAYEFRWLYMTKFGYYIAEAILLLAVISYFAFSVIWFAGLLTGYEMVTVRNILWGMSVTVAPIGTIIGFLFLGSKKNGGDVPGAIDNLSGVAVSLTVGKILKENPNLIPKDTEIRIISFGSEEAGVRGSKAYVKKHLKELKKKETYVINHDTLYCPEISIFINDRNATVKNDKEFVGLVEQAAINADVPFMLEAFKFGGGGTDIIPFSENKIPGVCLYAMKVPEDMIKFYHQRYDNYDIVNKETLINAVKINLEAVKLLK